MTGIGQGRGEQKLLCVQPLLYGVKPNPCNARLGGNFLVPAWVLASLSQQLLPPDCLQPVCVQEPFDLRLRMKAGSQRLSWIRWSFLNQGWLQFPVRYPGCLQVSYCSVKSRGMLVKFFSGNREHYAESCEWEEVLCVCGLSKNQNAFFHFFL